MTDVDAPRGQQYSHGTKADLRQGDLPRPGYASQFGKRIKAAFVYLTATLDAAIRGAELALGEGPGSIHIVEPSQRCRGSGPAFGVVRRTHVAER
jgi:Rifampin ADP-ribosyl transferase